jgi:uncharacterized protein (TIGR00156 family)
VTFTINNLGSKAMQKHLLKTTLFVVSVSASLSALATYIGPSSYPVYRTVAEVIKDGKDDEMAVLTGNVIKRVGKERFIFRDATGEIRLDIDQEKMPSQPFDEKSIVEVSGEVEREFMRSVEIDVHTIRIVK